MSKSDPIGSADAASILGVDRATFNRWAARGDVRVAFKSRGQSGMRLFNREDIERLATARRSATTLALPLVGLEVHDGDKRSGPPDRRTQSAQPPTGSHQDRRKTDGDRRKTA